MNPNQLPAWLPLLGFPAFAAFWIAIVYLIALVSGWRRLAQRFRASGPTSGTTWRFQAAGMRRYMDANYGNCLWVTANDEGLGLSILFLFRPGHPPLFLPWSKMLVSQERRLYFFPVVRLTFPSEPGIWIEIRPRLAEKIQAAIGHDWFAEPAE